MKKVYTFLIGAMVLFFCSVSFTSCGVHKTSAYASQESIVIADEMNGVYVIQTRGSATTRYLKSSARTRAMQDAKKRALHAVLFQTLVCQGTMQQTSLRPLVLEVNAEQKYESYFNDFFRDNGAWEDFATEAGNRYRGTSFSKTKHEYVCDMPVRVDRAGLRKKLIEDNILK